MSHGFVPAIRERWAVIVADKSGKFWQYAERDYREPILLPNKASANAYAAWLEEWASKRTGFADAAKMLPVNLDTFDFRSIELMWDTALDGLIVSGKRAA